MMRRYVFVPETFAKMSGRALSHPSRVHEHQGRLVLAN